jgi:hypothetical protein
MSLTLYYSVLCSFSFFRCCPLLCKQRFTCNLFTSINVCSLYCICMLHVTVLYPQFFSAWLQNTAVLIVLVMGVLLLLWFLHFSTSWKTVRSEIFGVMWTVVIWVMTSCSPVNGYQRFGDTCSLHFLAEDSNSMKTSNRIFSRLLVVRTVLLNCVEFCNSSLILVLEVFLMIILICLPICITENRHWILA